MSIKILLLNLSALLIFNCKMLSQPTIQWQKSFGGLGDDHANDFQITTDGGYIVAGHSSSNNGDVSSNHGGSDYWIVKLDNIGTMQWQKSFGGSNNDEAQSIQQTADGGYIVAGYSDSNNGDVSGNHGGNDYWIVKLDSTGTMQWQKSFGGTGLDNAYSIKKTSDGGYIVAGYSDSNNGDVSGNHGGTDHWVVKLNNIGTIQWQKCLGSSNNEWSSATFPDAPNSIQQTADGGYIIAGTNSANGSNNGDVIGNHGMSDYWLVKLNSSGTIVWQKSLGGTSNDLATSVQQTTDGGFVVTGYSFSNNGDVSGNNGMFDYWVVKLNISGTVLWQKALGSASAEFAKSIQQTLDGGYIVAGYGDYNGGDVTGNHGLMDYWIVKLNNSGTLVWQKSFGGSGYETVASIKQTSDGGYVVAGYSASNDGDVSGNNGISDYWIVKLLCAPTNISITQTACNSFIFNNQTYTTSGTYTQNKTTKDCDTTITLNLTIKKSSSNTITKTICDSYTLNGQTYNLSGTYIQNLTNAVGCDSIITLNLTISNSSSSIQWQKALGGSGVEYAKSIKQTTDGGYIVAGFSNLNNGDVSGNHGGTDYWIVKLNSSGTIVWQKSLGGTGLEYARSIQQTADGGYIIAGISNLNNGDVSGNHGGYDYWIVKLNSSGTILWQKSFGGTGSENANSIQQTADGGYIIAGTSDLNNGDVTGNHGGTDYWIVKLNSSGTIVWQKSFGGTGSEIAYSIQQTADGGYIIAGTSDLNNGDVTGNHGGTDYWIVKLNSSGTVVWQKSLGGTGSENANSIQQTADGGYIIAGTSDLNNGDVTGNHGGKDYWIVKLNSIGAILWQKSFGGSSIDIALSIQQTNDGGYILAGYSYSSDGDITQHIGGAGAAYYDYWILKLDNTGILKWQKSFGGSGQEMAESIQQTSDDGFIIAGQSTSNDYDVSGNHGNYDCWVVKLKLCTCTESTISQTACNSFTLNSSTYTSSGTYSQILTNATGCDSIVTLNLSIVTATLTPNGPTTFCQGGSVVLSANIGNGLTYQWKKNGANISGATATSYTATAAGSYVVVITNTLNCAATSNTATITVNNSPTVTAIASNTTICLGQTTTLSGGGATTYVWSGGVTNGTAFTPTATTIYTVTGTAATGCTNTATRQITVNNLPIVTANATSTVVCSGQAITLTGAGASTYVWSGGIINGTAFTPTANATYTVTGTAATGCTNTATKQITVNTLPTVTANATSTVVCSGQAITLTGAGASTYAWSGGVTNGVSFAPTVNATYTVTGTDVNGCTSTATRQITVNNLPIVTANATSTVVCAGQAITLTGGGASTYAWSGGVTNGVSFAPTVNATYTVTGTDVNGCINTATKAITVNNLPTVTANATSTVVCSGQSITLTGGGANTYAWSGGVTNGVSFAPTASVIYTVTGTAATGCTNTATRQITVNNLPTVTANATSSAVCLGQTTTLSGGGASTYTWSGGVTNGVSFAPTVNATYTVTGTDVNGCINTATKAITVNNLPAVTANATSTVVCASQAITLTGGGATTYAWSGGVTNGVAFAPTVNATYTVTGTDVNGCINTATKAITVNNLPTVTANATSTAVCLGQATTLTGAGAITYVWSGGVTNGVAFTPTVNATYTVTGTDVNGCSSAGVQSIIVNNLPAANINTSGPTTFCQGGSVILTADASNSYLWSNGATTQTVSATQTNNYTVQVTDNNGCSASSSVTSVNVNPTLVANITAAGATTFCQGGSVLLTANSASSYLWSNGAITQTINVTQAGSYSVQLTSGAGCSGTSSITTIVVNPLPNVTLGSIQSPLCVNNATVPLSGNPAGGVYSGIGVSGSSFDPSVSGAGTFTVNYNYTDANTCSATANQTVNVNLCTGILELNNETVSVYPNPASNMINVKMNTTLINNATLELYDATGKLIAQQKVVNEYSALNISGFANGIYTVRIITDNEQTIKRIVKQQ